MNNISNQLTITYNFINKEDALSNKDRRNVPAILAVDATLTIKVNDALYFEADLAILEFYKSLFMWTTEITPDYIPEFHYYSVEYADYEQGAILSLVPFSNQARLKTIWPQQELYNVFDIDYIVEELTHLERNLADDLVQYFGITLQSFVKHIPYTKTYNA